MKNKLSKIAIAMSAACYLFSSVTVYAAWSSSGVTDNYLSMGSYKTSIEEEYTQPGYVLPSHEVSKVVNVKNSGSVGTFVRVAVEKQIGDLDENGNFVPDTELDPEMIQISYNSNVWKDGGDGYFYYLKELKAGETTEEPLFKSFVFSEKAGNAYRKKQGHIVIKMESIQAEGNAISLWGKTASDLGIQYKEPEQSMEDTSVTFLGKEKGFDITSTQTDLFANFKNLMPGTSRTQEIKISNASDKEVEISLKAENAEQKKMTAKQLALVEKLLNEYADITITNNGETIYSGPVSGKPTMLNGSISLGKYSADSSKDMIVSLSVSPEMDNEYLNLLGKVRWVFTANGEETSSDPGSPSKSSSSTSVGAPKTGDISMTPAAVSFAAATVLLCSGLILTRKKEDDENA